MEKLFRIDWQSVFVPTVSVAEIMLRGTLIYLALFLFLRFLRREMGVIGIADLLVVVLIADASQNAMASDYKSVTEGIILVSTIAFWDYTLDWLAYRVPRLQKFVHPPPLLLVKDGELCRRNMRKEMITKEELMSQLREQGVEEVSEVKKAYMEGDGRISVISKNSQDGGRGKDANEQIAG